MNEQELRALVREAIDRHLDRAHGATKVAPYEEGTRDVRSAETPDMRGARLQSRFSDHASHIILNVAPGSEIDEGMCVIEPSVRCNHCGFCQSYGH